MIPSYAVPQANDPVRVVTLCRHWTRHGVDSWPEEFSDNRDRNYYRHALDVLGALESDGSPSPRMPRIASTDALESQEAFAEGLHESIVFSRWLEWAGANELTALDPRNARDFLMAEADLSESTAGRRASTLRKWLAWCTDELPPTFDDALGRALSGIDLEAPSKRALQTAKDVVARQLCLATARVELVCATGADDLADQLRQALRLLPDAVVLASSQPDTSDVVPGAYRDAAEAPPTLVVEHSTKGWAPRRVLIGDEPHIDPFPHEIERLSVAMEPPSAPLGGEDEKPHESTPTLEGPTDAESPEDNVPPAAIGTADRPEATPEPVAPSEGQNAFVAWNTTLIREFFSPAHEGEDVFLSTAKDELDDLAPELGGFEGLIGAVPSGPPWPVAEDTYPGDLKRLALGLMRQRRVPSSRPDRYQDPSAELPFGSAQDHMPTYLPILAALVAVSTEYEYGKGGFYEQARQLMGLHFFGTPHLEQINRLWHDLAQWTRDTQGRFGTFNRHVLGGYAHLGVLKSQGVFRSSDIERLGAVFARVGLAPGQAVRPADMPALLQAIESERRLSNGLREASRHPDVYGQLLQDRLGELLDDWDGTVPERARTGGAPRSRPRDLGVSLHLTRDGLPWRLGWILETPVDDGHAKLEHGSFRWETTFDGAPQAVASPRESDRTAMLLDHARYSDDERLDIELAIVEGEDLDNDDALVETYSFEHRKLRYLVYDAEHNCLLERDGLPGHGPSYLLVSPDNHSFDQVIEREGIALNPSGTAGLPSDWRLFWIDDCNQITPSQREHLPDGRQVHARPRVVRLTGGVRIRRGGRVLFLPYDLPRVEVDAPPNTELTAEGLDFHRVASTDESISDLRATSIQTYRIEVSDTRLQRFTLEARDLDGNVLGTATLRVPAGQAPTTAGAAEIGLARSGGTSTEEPLLAGVWLRGWDIPPRLPTRLEVRQTDLGRPLVSNPLRASFQQLPEAKFLDSLAQGGAKAIPYGKARDRLRSYLGRGERSVAATFRALARRGFLEMVTDRRGRWAQVARVPPTLYSLPIDVGGTETWGVAGTLGFHQWEMLDEVGDVRLLHRTPLSRLPVIRILGRIGTAQGFKVSRTPCTALAAFSMSLDELRSSLVKQGFEHLDTRSGQPDWFNPLTARWQRNRQAPDHYDWMLLRYTDPDTRVHRLHSLRDRQGTGHRYRHIRDERWGTWVAYDACVRTLEREGIVHGVAPWPLQYDVNTHSIWLPARMNFPTVIERALVAASGGPPVEIRLRRAPEQHQDGLMAQTESNALVGPFSKNYDELLPDRYHRIWLQYRFVPPELAAVIAERLGCRVDRI